MTLSVERDFDLGDVLTITTGKLVSPRHIEGVYDILGFITGETLFTHQLLRACDQCRPHILAQHPDLDGVSVPDGLDNEAAVFCWLEEAKAKHGAIRTIRAVPTAAPPNPIEELCDLVGAENVYVILDAAEKEQA